MRLPVLILLCWTAGIAAAQEPACRAVEGERILGRDLAAAIPAFAAMPADALLGTAPIPGSRRVFHSSEILALAQRYSLSIPAAQDVCFEWAMAPLDQSRALEAMRASLNLADAQIQIAESSASRVPPGRIEFPRDRLATPSPDQRSPVLWRGDVVYGDNRRFAIWARVDIKVPCNRLVATENLKSGEPIKASQLHSSASTCFPGPAGTALSVETAAGMAPLRFLPAGSEVRPELLAAANDVNRGDMVEIEVWSGAAHLAFNAQAISGGRIGDAIAIRNPDSQKIFQARVTGKDKAMVQASGSKGELR
jgi:flagella basal body P-ring formation protein FlgA